jgi:YHS domain-containing protein
MARFVLLLILSVVVARVFWRVVDGVVEGLTGRPAGRSTGRSTGQSGSTGVPGRGVQMVRDPVCGTFVVPDRAVTLTVGRQRLYFCSETCCDKYRARTA